MDIVDSQVHPGPRRPEPPVASRVARQAQALQILKERAFQMDLAKSCGMVPGPRGGDRNDMRPGRALLSDHFAVMGRLRSAIPQPGLVAD
jgi:hypothetical protein